MLTFRLIRLKITVFLMTLTISMGALADMNEQPNYKTCKLGHTCPVLSSGIKVPVDKRGTYKCHLTLKNNYLITNFQLATAYIDGETFGSIKRIKDVGKVKTVSLAFQRWIVSSGLLRQKIEADVVFDKLDMQALDQAQGYIVAHPLCKDNAKPVVGNEDACPNLGSETMYCIRTDS